MRLAGSARWPFLPLLFSLLLCAGGAAAQPVIAPGQERLLREMVGFGSALPGDCRASAAQIHQTRITVTYRCTGEAEHVLVLSHPSSNAGAAHRTRQLALSTGSDTTFPPELLQAIMENIRAGEADWEWHDPSQQTPRPATNSPPTAPRDFGLAMLAALWLLALLFLTLSRASRNGARRDGARPPFPGRTLLCPYHALLAIQVAVALIIASQLRFLNDDFTALITAVDAPWTPDGSHRFLSVPVLFRLGLLLGNHQLFFAAANVAAFGLTILFWYKLLIRLGFSRAEAALACALCGLAPGQIDLLRWPMGFQQLAAGAVIIGALLAVVAAAQLKPQSSWQDRAALLALALALTATGLMVKYAVVLVLPVSAWFVGRLVVARPCPPLNRHVFHLLWALPFLALWLAGGFQGGDRQNAGWTAMLDNLGQACSFLAYPLVGCTGALILLVLPGLVSSKRGWARRLGKTLWTAIRSRVGAVPLYLFATVLSLLWLFPFLLNAHYFSDHYVRLAFMPIAALLARWAVGAAASPRLVWMALPLAAACLIPWWRVIEITDDTTSVSTEAWLAEIRTVAAGRDRPGRVILMAACPTGGETRESAEELGELHSATERGAGLRWVTGWHDVDVTLARDDEEIPESDRALVLVHCRGRPVRVRE